MTLTLGFRVPWLRAKSRMVMGEKRREIWANYNNLTLGTMASNPSDRKIYIDSLSVISPLQIKFINEML
ncbi:hypothetical protein XM38_009120 [Halomicronema hongdechloris C2206]|uniref:Uncharacterized protein n=1 Tax=Halomicronema hongdechloris C2206 TaxID=1641165 RepID=A0A1Z3HI34_9CYAN|nr:hypothetical protein XM38_009120 [Halomicronema hongdechloris C2206]